MRRMAKAVNFGIVYGISDFGLSRDLGITRKEAAAFIDKYYDRYPGVKQYMEKTIAQAREQGYVTTILNRRRYLPDLFSSNRNVRNFGERTAMNTPIQGSAADIIKLAMLGVDREIRARGLNVSIVLQVHDELIFELPEAELEKAAAMIKFCMENAYELNVPLEVDMKYGRNWYEMESINL
jgi:DNA polymerase-1